jgi:hypothetical protein
MKIKKKPNTITGIMVSVLLVSLFTGCMTQTPLEPTPAPEATTEMITYSKWGFTLEYPDELQYVLLERGFNDEEANVNSGGILLTATVDELYYKLTWAKLDKLSYDYFGEKEICLINIERISFIESTPERIFTPGEVKEDKKEGHYLIYQYNHLSAPNIDKERYSIAACFICDHLDEYTIFTIDTAGTHNSTKEEAFELYQSFIDSLKCH